MERLAIIIPCLNEENNIYRTSNILLKYLFSLIRSGDISNNSYLLFVDDGSQDMTWRNINKVKSKYPENIKAIRLMENTGHQNALLCGMYNSKYDICITLDADLQDDHTKIPLMVSKYKEGYEIVCGVKKIDLKHNTVKNFFSCIYYFFLNTINRNIIISHADYRLMSKKAVYTMKKRFSNKDLFIRGAVPFLKYPIYKFKYKIIPRKYGVTRYTPFKILNLARYGILLFRKEIGKFLGVLFIYDFFIDNLFNKKISIFLRLSFIWLLFELLLDFLFKHDNNEKKICERIV